MGRIVSAREAFVIAYQYQRENRCEDAAIIYRQLLDNAETREWMRKQDMLPTLYQNLSSALHALGRTDLSIDAFTAAVAAAGATDDEFDGVYLRGVRRSGVSATPLRRRMRLRNLVALLRSTAGVPGEVAECGCYRGLSSYVICSELRSGRPSFSGDGYHVFDSFEGLSAPGDEDRVPPGFEGENDLQGMTRRGNFAASLEQVRRTLEDFPDVAYHPGWIPASFDGLPERRYRFVHVDVDLYAPTAGALEYFFPRLAPGGRIVSDDYNWPGAKKAIDAFCGARGVALEVTPHSQACIVG